MRDRRANQSDFLLKYGDGKHIDRLMRVDHPEWPGRGQAWDAIKPMMYHTVSTALKNPMISTKAVVKAAALPHEFTSSLMGDYLKRHDDVKIHPDILTAIAKHQGHREYIRSALQDRYDTPKEAYRHLASHVSDRIARLNPSHPEDQNLKPHYEKERDFYLQKAQ